ncbi:MAG: serine hydrolase [Bacteroidales bacterium]
MRVLVILSAIMLAGFPQGLRNLVYSTHSAERIVPPLPMNIPPDSVKFLRDVVDPELQADLLNEINQNPKWKRLVSDKKMAVGLVDLSDPYNVRYARLNGNVMMYAASLPKIGILLAVEDALEKGEVQDSPEIRAKMRLMIAKSSNAAATELIDLVGFDKIESVLKDPVYDLYDEEYGGGLWVGKRYAKTGERHPDPLFGISHGATVTQVCRFYYLMAYGQLVSRNRSAEMLSYMDNPELNHKFINTLRTIAPQAHFYRKSGTWQSYHSDSVLVWGPERRYILVALIDDPDGEAILRRLVVPVDNLLRQA